MNNAIETRILSSNIDGLDARTRVLIERVQSRPFLGGAVAEIHSRTYSLTRVARERLAAGQTAVVRRLLDDVEGYLQRSAA